MKIKHRYVGLNLDGLISIALIVLAILINFTTIINPAVFPYWLYAALKGWSAIPFIIFAPIIIVICIGLIATALIFVAAVIIALLNKIFF